jgi:hypothetical protein
MIISAICFKQPTVKPGPPVPVNTKPPVPVNTKPPLIVYQDDKNEVIDYTDRKLNQVMTEMTGYPNMDDLMAVVFQEYLKANNISAIERPEEKRLIRWYCCRRIRIWRWWVCVKWCFEIGFGKK